MIILDLIVVVGIIVMMTHIPGILHVCVCVYVCVKLCVSYCMICVCLCVFVCHTV